MDIGITELFCNDNYEEFIMNEEVIVNEEVIINENDEDITDLYCYEDIKK